MDQGTLQGIGTILAMIAFAAVVLWAYSKDKKQDFEEASQLPFDDDELDAIQQNQEKRQDSQ